MDNPDNSASSDPRPPAVSDQEVERILREAETLAQEIVQTVDIDPSDSAAAAMPSGQFGVVEPDPLAAVELVAQDTAALRETLSDQASITENEQVKPAPAPSAEPSRSNSATQPVTNSGAGEVCTADTQTAPAQERHAVSAKSADPSGPSGKPAAPTAPKARIRESRRADDVILPGTVPAAGHFKSTPASPNSAATPSAVQTTEQTASTPNGRFTRDVLRELAVLFPNAIMRLVILIDRPFAWIPPVGKQMIGMVGLITLLMGVATFILPRMLERNPYATMEPLPKVAAEAGAEPESSHEHASHSESAEHKPSEEHSAHH